MRLASSMVVLGALTTDATAAPKVPASCEVSLAMPKRDPRTPFAGKIHAIVADRSMPQMRAVTIAQPAGKLVMNLWSSRALPFQVGDAVSGEYDCSGGGFHLVCDAVFLNAKQEPILVLSGSGRTELAAGWTIAIGKIVTSTQDVNQAQKSVQREHALNVTHGRVTASTVPNGCIRVTDGGTSWLVSGSAISWEGIRPPEGIDYSSFSITRE